MKILIVDDDHATRKGIEFFLRNLGLEVESAENGAIAFEKQNDFRPDLIVSDVMMPEMTGLELLTKLQEHNIKTPFIIMTAFVSIQDAVLAMKKGAEDYLPKPLNLEELSIKINKIRQKISLVNENLSLKSRLQKFEFPEIIGNCKKMKDVFQSINRISEDPDIPVMIYGESGTGKELVARTIHGRSERQKHAFIAVNCAAIPDELMESEFFGHQKGAFTGAISNKIGFFKAADKGTLFLDEVSEMSQRLQAKLLRVLQENKFQPVGMIEETTVDVRVLGASNKNLKDLVNAKQFREDLFYRLNVMEVNLPPLRERLADIPILTQHFIEKYSKENCETKKLTKETLSVFQDYDWPGNVREMENLVRVLLVSSTKDTIDLEFIPKNMLMEKSKKTKETHQELEEEDYKKALRIIIENFEREFFLKHLHEQNGNISKTADKVGLSRVALHKKIKQYNLKT
jgi:DNA-binding NtrC family response regulator